MNKSKAAGFFLICIALMLFGCSDKSTAPDNSEPNAPTNPVPGDGAIDVLTSTTLSWECSDPDFDPLTYDVYLGTSATPQLVSSGQSSTFYEPDTLLDATVYYWKIIAHDDQDNSTTGNIWQFTTEPGAFGTVTDIDGNVYQTLIIGNQEWMIENLRVTHFQNGDEIPHVTDNDLWSTSYSCVYCVYENDPSYAETYGNIYNWFAAGDGRNLAPDGWQIPTDEDWQELVDFLGGEDIAGGKMKETGTSHWVEPNTGATNESGFTALPGGCRSGYDGCCSDMGLDGFFWTSTEHTGSFAYIRRLFCGNASIGTMSSSKRHGYSVRCVRSINWAH